MTAVTEGLEREGIAIAAAEEPDEVSVSEDAAVVFDGAWFAAHSDDTGVEALLDRTVRARGVVLVVDGDTSKLLEKLRELELTWFSEGRNPAYTDPPQVGFRWTCESDTCEGGATLMSNTTDPHGLVNAIGRWYTRPTLTPAGSS